MKAGGRFLFTSLLLCLLFNMLCGSLTPVLYYELYYSASPAAFFFIFLSKTSGNESVHGGALTKGKICDDIHDMRSLLSSIAVCWHCVVADIYILI